MLLLKYLLIIHKIRLKRHVLNHPYGPKVLESSYLPGWPITQTDAVPLPSIWTLHGTVCLLKDHKANNAVPMPVRHSPDKLFRRSVTSSTHQGSTVGESFNNTMAVHQPGVHDKYPKVQPEHSVRYGMWFKRTTS